MEQANKPDKFKLEIDTILPIPRTVTYRFSNLKIMRQWQKRKGIPNVYWCISYREYLLNNNNEWERFIVFGKSIVRLSELEEAVKRLKDEGFNSSLGKI